MRDSRAIVLRRNKYRPSTVTALLVGESAPASGRHFYLANSGLFDWTRTAFAQVYGKSTPEGEAFLGFFREAGFWLVDVADGPVNDLDRVARKQRVRAGQGRLVRTLHETRPAVVVAVKRGETRKVVLKAIGESQVNAEFESLPFPNQSWQWKYVAGLVPVIRRMRRLTTKSS